LFEIHFQKTTKLLSTFSFQYCSFLKYEKVGRLKEPKMGTGSIRMVDFGSFFYLANLTMSNATRNSAFLKKDNSKKNKI
jgi:hypothetical protein